MPRLIGKKALITGGGGGIGRKIGEMFAAEGALVMLSDIDGDAAMIAADAINSDQMGHASSCRHDVTSENDWEKAIRACEDQMGGLNVLVNNAGIAIVGNIEDLEPDTWREMIDVNLNSVYFGCRAALPCLRRFAPASIVNISSVSGLIAGHNLAAYNASKAAVWMLTKSVALQTAREGADIRVNSIHPAFIDTRMLGGVISNKNQTGLSKEQKSRFAMQIPLRRIGETEDVGYAAVYLASDESKFMTGAEIKIDGGLTAM